MKKNDIPALTGLRGLAALLIVVHHFGLLVLPLRSTLAGPALGKCGLLGMSIFFVLSGFVIHYNYAAKIAKGGREITDFVVARFARLYPLYIVFVLANFAFNLTVSNQYLRTFPYFLFGVQSWFYTIHYGQILGLAQVYANNAWSISTEVGLYLLFVPLVMIGRFGASSARKGVAIVAIAIVGRIAFVRLSTFYGGDFLQTHFGTSASFAADDWLIYLSPYGRAFEFLAGVGISEIWSAGKIDSRARKLAMGLGVASVAYIVAGFLDGTAYSHPALFSGNATHIGYVVAVPLAILAVCLHGIILCGKTAIWIGEVSYSLYLVHGVLLPMFEGRGSSIGYVTMTIMFLAILIAVSALTYYFIELPAQKFIKSTYWQRRARPQTASVVLVDDHFSGDADIPGRR